MLSITHARTSHRQSTKSFSENVVVAGTSYQMKEAFYHFSIGRGIKGLNPYHYI